MPDREKVIKATELLDDFFNEYREVYYISPHEAWEIIKDTLKEQEGTISELQNAYGYLQKQFFEVQDKLLKEQEAVVHPEPSCEMTYITDCCCDLCGVQLIREDIFCRCCGKRIEWEGR